MSRRFPTKEWTVEDTCAGVLVYIYRRTAADRPTNLTGASETITSFQLPPKKPR